MPKYHITIGGKRYDRALYQQAVDAVRGQGDGRISKADAEKLVAKVLDHGPGQEDVYTDVEKRTVKLLRETFNWTDAADQHFRHAIRSDAALRSWDVRAQQDKVAAGDAAEPAGPSAADAVDAPPPAAAESVDAVVRRVLDELGLSHMRVDIPEAEVRLQEAEFPSAVGFEQALRQALRSFLEDGAHVESPREIIRDADLAPDVPTEIGAAVHDFMDRPTTSLALVHSGPFDRDNPGSPYPPEHGEPVAENWAFLLRIDELSDHLHWAIVDRSGDRAPYNYGFN